MSEPARRQADAPALDAGTTAGLSSQPLPPPTADAFARLKALFDAVCDLPDQAAVQARLQSLGALPAEAAEVLALWQADAAGRTHLGAPVAGMLASASRATTEQELHVGDALGPWKLVAPLGAGGMGQVFLAERNDGLYEQRAAIKLLRGWQGAEAQAHLARERRILASLQHPHIAALVDGGSTPAGRPYLVMAYVDGLPLDQWCRHTQAGFHIRLAQLQTVAEAIAHAHRKLVVHCDIKPANVLVDAEGRAMLLDFGIAQLQDKGDDGAPRALTPRYASPEQRAGEPAQMVSDIYALGRVLEELLAAPEAGAEAQRRRPEWQAIVARACAEAPSERYASVDALVADIQRLRAHRPLQALRAAGWPYRLRKLLRRQWPWALAGTAAAVLAGVSVVQLVQQRDRALHAEAMARAEAATARQVGELLTGLFEGADPARGGRPDMPARALVDRGLARVTQDLASHPEQQAAMLAVLAKVYDNMGRWAQAAEAYARAATLEEELQRPLRAAALLRAQSLALSNSGQRLAAEQPARRALALFDAAAAGPAQALDDLAAGEGTGLGTAPPTRAAMLVALGTVLAVSGGHEEAAGLLRQAVALTKDAAPDDRAGRLEHARALHAMGILHDHGMQPEQAAQQLLQALEIKRALLGDADLSTLTSAQRVVPVLGRLGRSDEAERLAREVVQRRIDLTGAESEPVAGALNELGNVLQDAGRQADAIPVYAQAVAITRASAGPRTALGAQRLNNLASAYEDLGSPAAGPLYRESLAIRSELLPAGDLSIARAQNNLGRWLLRQGDVSAAMPLLEAASRARAAKLPPGSDERVASELVLAEATLLRGRREAAQAMVEPLLPLEPRMTPVRQAALWRLQGRLLQARGDSAGALPFAERALARVMERQPKAQSQMQARLEAAELQLALGRREAAQATLGALWPLVQAHHPNSPWLARAQRLQAQLRAAGLAAPTAPARAERLAGNAAAVATAPTTAPTVTAGAR